ncbi:hypothetical protein SAMN05421665_0509 [Yoonia rosea]|uniref:Response regulator receiver domain-containing protein n=1 Tax=Yoonia rosea TaxID=287098 RepID=A0A1R3WGW6_9RHOB|nr:hypothetical protein [Yoonia rosea]SIT77155.1 hypothetical protein SAMN05421665_0509 [Yoonia rosea]
MSAKVVVIDDTSEKYTAILDFFERYFPTYEVSWFKNFRQSQNNLLYFDYDLLILDMSFERHGATSEDVAFNGLAGLHVLQFLWVENISLPTVILTTHDRYTDPDFGEIVGLDALKGYIHENFGDVVMECLSLGPDEKIWHEQLAEVIINAEI